MIVCSCNFISDSSIKSCLNSLDKITVSEVFKKLNVDPQCATCVQTIVKIIQEHKNIEPLE